MKGIALKMRSAMLQRVGRSKQVANTTNTSVMVLIPSLRNNVLFRQYSTDDSKVTKMAEKARSTAEEFLCQAKEKKDEISEAAKETFDDTKEAVIGETEQDKEKFKEMVEKGDYDRIGRP